MGFFGKGAAKDRVVNTLVSQVDDLWSTVSSPSISTPPEGSAVSWPFNGRIITVEQRTIVRWLVHWALMGELFFLYSEKDLSGASVPTSYYSMWHRNYIYTTKEIGNGIIG